MKKINLTKLIAFTGILFGSHLQAKAQCTGGVSITSFPTPLIVCYGAGAPCYSFTVTGTGSYASGANVTYEWEVYASVGGTIYLKNFSFCNGTGTFPLGASSGTTGTSTGTTVEIQILGNPSPSSGFYVRVRGLNTNGCTSSYDSQGWYRGDLSTPTLSGQQNPQTCNCYTYTCGSVDGAAAYVWSSNITGVTITPCSPQPCLTAIVCYPSSFSSGNITVYAENYCGHPSGNRNLSITGASGSPTWSSSISGRTVGVAPMSAEIYSVPAYAGATSYDWEIYGVASPPISCTGVSGSNLASSMISGNGTTGITVDFDSDAPGNCHWLLRVRAVIGSCGNTTWICLNIDGKPSNFSTANIVVDPSGCITDGGDLQANGAYGAVSWTWTPSVTGTNCNPPQIDVNLGNEIIASQGQCGGGCCWGYTAQASNACGSNTTIGMASCITTCACRLANPNMCAQIISADAQDLEYFTLEIDQTARYLITLSDISGRTVLKTSLAMQAGENKISLQKAELSKGIYLYSVSGNNQTFKGKLYHY